jgi:hypothetical protein
MRLSATTRPRLQYRLAANTIGLFDVLEKKTAEVENIIKPIKGFVSYSASSRRRQNSLS